MSAQVQGTLLDVLKKKMRQTKEEMEKYKDECEEYQRRLQVEVMRREEVSEPCSLSLSLYLVFSVCLSLSLSLSLLFSLCPPDSSVSRISRNSAGIRFGDRRNESRRASESRHHCRAIGQR